MNAKEFMKRLGEELMDRGFVPSIEATMREFEAVPFETEQHVGNFRSLAQVAEEMKGYVWTGEKIKDGEKLAITIAERIMP